MEIRVKDKITKRKFYKDFQLMWSDGKQGYGLYVNLMNIESTGWYKNGNRLVVQYNDEKIGENGQKVWKRFELDTHA